MCTLVEKFSASGSPTSFQEILRNANVVWLRCLLSYNSSHKKKNSKKFKTVRSEPSIRIRNGKRSELFSKTRDALVSLPLARCTWFIQIQTGLCLVLFLFETCSFKRHGGPKLIHFGLAAIVAISFLGALLISKKKKKIAQLLFWYLAQLKKKLLISSSCR